MELVDQEYDLDLRIKRPEAETDDEWAERLKRIRQVTEGVTGFGTTGWATITLATAEGTQLVCAPPRVKDTP